jgi:outer membrane protein OmpA-like peptidoglycan-associated protein
MQLVRSVAMAVTCLATTCVFVATARAYPPSEKPDAVEGAKDHPMIPGFPSAVITEYEQRDFEEYDLPVGVVEGEFTLRKVEGRLTRIAYDNPQKASATEIVRNYQAALQKAGFKTLLDYKTDGNRRLTAELDSKGHVWVDFEVTLANSSFLTVMVVVEGKVMEQKIELDAAGMLEELGRTGHVAVYGINFATGKADVTPESAQVLSEIGKLLKENVDLRLRVEGHTDNVGASKENLALSKRRAAAVKAWLVQKHAVKGDRLGTEGYGDSRPVADNKTDAGRASNRRVELVKL